MDNERQRAYERRLKDADDLRSSSSYVVFLGWIVVEVVATAIFTTAVCAVVITAKVLGM
jgi:hypothetical protein